MKYITDIYKIIEKEKILYEERDLSKFKSKGLYIKLNGYKPMIFIDKKIIHISNTYISILAEELGHYFTTHGDLIENSKSFNDSLLKIKKESLAREWAAKFLINNDEFLQALLACICSKYDMCEYFNVNSEILSTKINSILRDEKKYKEIKEKLKEHEFQYNSCTI
ncbi:ImmA/IrrE family metallo-endopeptidase [Clostridium cuniculi]|uniref:ImmA/IrrE family metallo-endopeptidase n=1 Tax=Clostridium cuniculi TaxID=2548455 RepID=UPI001056D25C|nr:ImmA/IrrE family metallo-endopeptidase [Clostridium cuniculi]